MGVGCGRADWEKRKDGGWVGWDRHKAGRGPLLDQTSIR